MSKLIALSKPILSAAAFVVVLTLAGCSADAIMGPETAEAVTVDARSIPHGQHPGNDDCSVGGC